MHKFRSFNLPEGPTTRVPDRRPVTDGIERTEHEEPDPGFLGRVHSYNRLMHAHTRSQMGGQTGRTVPSYQKTMHFFTLGQLAHHRRTSKSADSSPLPRSRAGKTATPLRAVGGLKPEVTNDLVLVAPSNTPECEEGERMPNQSPGAVQKVDLQKRKRRSTDPLAVASQPAMPRRGVVLV